MLAVQLPSTEEDDEPWTALPSRRSKEPAIESVLPELVEVVLGNQVYIDRSNLPPVLVNRIGRLAAFQNPEFYTAQAMRLSTFGKPRVISCAKLFSKHVALPRGCLDDLLRLFADVGIRAKLRDERQQERTLETRFLGELTAEQKKAYQFVRPAAWRLLGPALGGVLVGWSVGGAFLVDAGTFGVSIVALLMMSPHPIDGAASGDGSALSDVREGFRFVRARVWLWGTLLAATFAYLLFIGPQEVLLPLLVKNDWGGNPLTLGIILAMGGVGAIGAALVMGHRGAPRRFITFMYVAWTFSTLAVAGYGLAHVPWQAMIACLLFNALETAGTIVWATTKQRLVPRHLLGRVSSLDWFISIGLLPLSFALTGPAANLFGTRATLIGAGVLGAIVTLSFLFLPGMRSIEREPLPEHAPEREEVGPTASPI
jgi:hypothetical protein